MLLLISILIFNCVAFFTKAAFPELKIMFKAQKTSIYFITALLLALTIFLCIVFFLEKSFMPFDSILCQKPSPSDPESWIKIHKYWKQLPPVTPEEIAKAVAEKQEAVAAGTWVEGCPDCHLIPVFQYEDGTMAPADLEPGEIRYLCKDENCPIGGPLCSTFRYAKSEDFVDFFMGMMAVWEDFEDFYLTEQQKLFLNCLLYQIAEENCMQIVRAGIDSPYGVIETVTYYIAIEDLERIFKEIESKALESKFLTENLYYEPLQFDSDGNIKPRVESRDTRIFLSFCYDELNHLKESHPPGTKVDLEYFVHVMGLYYFHFVIFPQILNCFYSNLILEIFWIWTFWGVVIGWITFRYTLRKNSVFSLWFRRVFFPGQIFLICLYLYTIFF